MNNTEKIFRTYEIVKRKNAVALEIFSDIYPDFTKFGDLKPSEYISRFWDKYERGESFDNSINGKVFEYLIVSLLINREIMPFYIQAKVAFVPNVDFDLLLYSKEGPIAVSVKTSLRERYKQADLEAIALKYVHRKARCYLLTLNSDEAGTVNEKIKKGEVIGIDKVVDARTDVMNRLMDEWFETEFCEAGTVDIVKASTIVKRTE